MQMEWQSRKGTARSNNSDAAAICSWDNTAVIALVDAAQSHSSVELASYWVRRCVMAGIHYDSPWAYPNQIIQTLQQDHHSLRHDYLHDRASYLLVCLDLAHRQGSLLFVGDCLLGIESDGATEWLNTPHTAEAHFQQHAIDTNMHIEGAEHILTRALKARRFEAPEHFVFTWPKETQLVIATDGHWRKYKEDDASLLRFATGPDLLEIQQNTATQNLFVFGRENLVASDLKELT